MKRSRVATVTACFASAGALALTGGAAAQADGWPAPPDLPAGAWYGEAPTGTYRLGWSDAVEVTTLPGARLVLKYPSTSRPDGTTGPAWFWFNTRPGSTFALTGCPDAGLAHAVRVPRNRFQRGVRAGVERDFSFTYDARGNTGHFEVAVRDEGQRPRPPRCLQADVLTDELPRPDDVGPDTDSDVVWAEGGSFEGRNDDNEGAGLRVHDGEWLVVSYAADEVVHRWYSTRGPSRYFLNFCDPTGTPYSAQVTREEFFAREAAVPTQKIRFDYDAVRDVGRFEVGSWTDQVPCEVRPR